jgi:hypothetical protein
MYLEEGSYETLPADKQTSETSVEMDGHGNVVGQLTSFYNQMRVYYEVF